MAVYRAEDFAVFEWMFLGDLIADQSRFIPYVDTLTPSAPLEDSSSGKVKKNSKKKKFPPPPH